MGSARRSFASGLGLDLGSLALFELSPHRGVGELPSASARTSALCRGGPVAVSC